MTTFFCLKDIVCPQITVLDLSFSSISCQLGPLWEGCIAYRTLVLVSPPQHPSSISFIRQDMEDVTLDWVSFHIVTRRIFKMPHSHQLMFKIKLLWSPFFSLRKSKSWVWWDRSADYTACNVSLITPNPRTHIKTAHALASVYNLSSIPVQRTIETEDSAGSLPMPHSHRNRKTLPQKQSRERKSILENCPLTYRHTHKINL